MNAIMAVLAIVCILELANRMQKLDRLVRGIRLTAHENRCKLASIENDLRVCNPHARMLGRVVEARKYEAYDWEPCVVVGVGWHGSLGLRKLSELDRRGFWIKHNQVPTHVREIGETEVTHAVREAAHCENA